MSKRADLSGKTFGSLLVGEFLRVENTHAIWKTLCSCGYSSDMSSTNLVSGNTTKCAECRAQARRKLTDDDVADMKALIKKGISLASIASDYGVSRSTVLRNTK